MDSLVLLVSSVLLISLGYTYFISKMGEPPARPAIQLSKIPHLARAKELRRAQRDLEAKHVQLNTISFPFFRLPAEITLLVLNHCADWPGTYISLTQVSRRVQRLTFSACLPRMPIKLIDERQIPPFDLFLRKNPQLPHLVHNIWLAPIRNHLVEAAVRILKSCVNLRSLGSFPFIIQEAIAYRSVVLHSMCRNLTMLHINEEGWTNLLGAAGGPAFFKQLTHLRLVGHCVPENIPLPKLTHLSYRLNHAESNIVIGEKMLHDVISYPSLHTIIVTREQIRHGELRESKQSTAKIYILDAPFGATEIVLWQDNVRKRGMWEVSAEFSTSTT